MGFCHGATQVASSTDTEQMEQYGALAGVPDPQNPIQPAVIRIPVPKPAREPNRCNLRHVAPKTLQKALYVGFSQIGRPLQVVYFGESQFPFPEAPLAGQAGPIYGLTPCGRGD